MPPVLGPVSPSPMRLWSCAAASATAGGRRRGRRRRPRGLRAFLRGRAIRPAAEQVAGEHLVRCGAGIAVGFAKDYALAGGEAVGLDDDVVAAKAGRAASTSARVRQTAYCAVGMPWRCMKSFAKALLVSSMRGGAGGAEDAEACGSRASTTPAARGTSGPMTTRSGCSWAASARLRGRCDVERHAAGEGGDAAVAGGADDLGDARALAQGPDERVLAAAAADDENLHASKLALSLVAACAATAGRPEHARCYSLVNG